MISQYCLPFQWIVSLHICVSFSLVDCSNYLVWFVLKMPCEKFGSLHLRDIPKNEVQTISQQHFLFMFPSILSIIPFYNWNIQLLLHQHMWIDMIPFPFSWQCDVPARFIPKMSSVKFGSLQQQDLPKNHLILGATCPYSTCCTLPVPYPAVSIVGGLGEKVISLPLLT